MLARIGLAALALLGASSPGSSPGGEGGISWDSRGYDPSCGIRIEPDGDRCRASWTADSGKPISLELDASGGKWEIARLALGDSALLEHTAPAIFLTVGTRQPPPDRPPGMDPFNAFFDSPAARPHETFPGRFAPSRGRISSSGQHAVIAIGDLTAGPFSGEWRIHLFADSRLIRLEAALKTAEDRRAILYDIGLVGGDLAGRRFAWSDERGAAQSRAAGDGERPSAPIGVKRRAIALESGDASASLALFPPPHQFFDPRDYTDNLKNAWLGAGHRFPETPFGFGLRQAETGGGRFAPWFNAPPGTEQRLGAFLALADGKAEGALAESARYTRGDRFPSLPGYLTYASHWHMAIAVKGMAEARRPRPVPSFVPIFKGMGVNLVHLGEFHGDGHPDDPGPLRLPELAGMFDECRRWSDGDLLMIPGEEANCHFGVRKPHQPPGHWMLLFPRPVFWTMNRGPGRPFVEEDPKYGKVYHAGDAAEMLRLIEEERGLAWTAHPRIKSSSWAPDAYRDADYYRSGRWLGAAWKAMPADLSREKLGERGLDLLDDMANWGGKKYLPGEVDVFTIDETHELYGHMNINYLRLDRVPRFDEGWAPVLDALSGGAFFTTTGEVLIPEFTVGRARSGEQIAAPATSAAAGEGPGPELRARLMWTFPLRFAEVVSGDGQSVTRERIDLGDTGPFGARELALRPRLSGKRWVRLEVWDVAANGAYTQPVWLDPPAEGE